MDQVQQLALVAGAVLAVNLIPAFGPPTWAVLVLLSLHTSLATPTLVVVGAAAAATGRLLLAHGTRRLGAHIPEQHRQNLQAAGELVHGRRGTTIGFLAVFALSPLPSAQLFEAAGLLSTRLLPLTGAFFAGRIVSYSLYVGGATALAGTDTGKVLLSGMTSPWAVAFEVVALAGLVALARIDWVGRARRRTDPAPARPTE